jgi:phosphoglycerate dehydrogenase-like enzyme
MATTKIMFSPKFPKPVFDVAVEMTPPGFELVPVDATGPQFLEVAREAEYFMGFGRNPLSTDFYTAAKKLKLVQLISAGYNTLDLEAARKAGVPIANNGGANSVAVAEHAVMLILASLKKLAWQHKNCVEGKWRVGDFAETRLYELEGKTVGIVGLGNIGKKVARRLHGFDVRIVYYDIVRLAEHDEDALGVRFVLLDELLKMSDVVTLHVPLSAQTKDMISDRQLSLMKPTAVLVNTCRGPVVDEVALHKALITKRIAGAGLDVMVDEPPSRDNPLLNVDTITITPHTAGPTWENWPKAFRNAFDNILRVHAGRKPMWVIPELRSLVAG